MLALSTVKFHGPVMYLGNRILRPPTAGRFAADGCFIWLLRDEEPSGIISGRYREAGLRCKAESPLSFVGTSALTVFEAQADTLWLVGPSMISSPTAEVSSCLPRSITSRQYASRAPEQVDRAWRGGNSGQTGRQLCRDHRRKPLQCYAIGASYFGRLPLPRLSAYRKRLSL